jgi:DNA-binding winged helix-turn-helix (wHTH) protein/tetratricopeptide (TPR) repeat protein
MTVIDLAQCEDFDLGDVTVRPSTREILRNGISEILEPKVMQVLVALGSTPMRVVSRDELIEKCWNARFVGEDAINRVIGKLRRAAASAAAGTFRIDTVARVGYRLSLAESMAETPVVESTSSLAEASGLSRANRLTRWALAAIAGVTILWAVVEARWPHKPAVASQGGSANTAEPVMPSAVSSLETRGLSAMFENTREQTAEGVAYLQQATALAPRSAPVWGSLAMGYVLSLGWAAPGERAAVAQRARDAAAHALAIDPHESRSIAAIVSLEPTFGHWQAKANALRAANRRADGEAGPLLYQQVQFLIAVGRTREALPLIERLAKYSPLVPWIQAARVDLLAANGRLDDADHIAREALTIWPRDRLTWFTSFDLAAFNGQPERALAMASARANWPKNTAPAEILLAQDMVRAMVAQDPAETTRVIAAFTSSARRGPAEAERAMRAAAALARPAEALEFARQLYLGKFRADPRRVMLQRIGLDDEGERPTAALFVPPAQLLWKQPGFLAQMSDIGLVRYWRGTAPPDLCKTVAMAKACRDAHLLDR